MYFACVYSIDNTVDCLATSKLTVSPLIGNSKLNSPSESAQIVSAYMKLPDFSILKETSMNAAHYHNYYEIYFLMNGKCNLLIKDRSYDLILNDLVLIPRSAIHKMTYLDSIRKRAALTFTKDYIAPCFGDELEEVWRINVFRAKDAGVIKEIFDKIAREAFNENDISKELLRCYLTELLAYVARHKKYLVMDDQSQSNPMKHVMDYILENYASNITLDELAALSGYSKNYFSKIFKDVVGVGYKEYTVLVRLKAAERLLRATNKSVREIATSCGFNDSNYFSTVFQNKYGVPPTQYKKDQFIQFLEK